MNTLLDFLLGWHPFLTALAPTMVVIAIAWGVLPNLKRDVTWHRMFIVGLVTFACGRYYLWRATGLATAASDGSHGVLAWSVFLMENLGLVEAAISALMLSRTVDRSGEADRAEKALAESGCYPVVDVFIPTYNEGIEVLEKTILGALALDWPSDRLNVWVLDDGRRDWLREYCSLKGARYLTRSDNSHAKAGNINAAIRITDGEFIAVFDADFVPRRQFLKRTIGLFKDPHIGCVQTPHHFYNADPVQANLLMNGMLPDDQRMFFDVVMPSRDAWDAAFCCGSCGVLRRAAVERIGGGIPTASVTEDILTSLAMKRAGYITRFLNEKLAFGLAAESVEAFFVQRERWARGGIQLLFLKDGPLGPGLGIVDRLLFLPASWVVQYAMRVFGFVLPALCLWTGLSPMPGVSPLDIASEQFPFLLSFFFMMRWFAPDHHVPLLTAASQCFASIRLAPSVASSLIKPFGVPFRVTPKGAAASGFNVDRRTLSVAAILMAATVGGLAMSLAFSKQHGLFLIVAAWSFWNVALLGIVMLICFEVPRRRQEERFPASEPAAIIDESGIAFDAVALDYSLSGGRARCLDPDLPSAGEEIMVDINDVGRVRATVVARDGVLVRFIFSWSGAELRDRMIVKLFASGKHEAGLRQVEVSEMLQAAFTRLFGRTWLETKVAGRFSS